MAKLSECIADSTRSAVPYYLPCRQTGEAESERNGLSIQTIPSARGMMDVAHLIPPSGAGQSCHRLRRQFGRLDSDGNQTI